MATLSDQPKEFRLPGKEARVRRVGSTVVPGPIGESFDIAAAKLDEHGAEFLPEGRPEQPPMPPPRKIFDERSAATLMR